MGKGTKKRDLELHNQLLLPPRGLELGHALSSTVSDAPQQKKEKWSKEAKDEMKHKKDILNNKQKKKK